MRASEIIEAQSSPVGPRLRGVRPSDDAAATMPWLLALVAVVIAIAAVAGGSLPGVARRSPGCRCRQSADVPPGQHR